MSKGASADAGRAVAATPSSRQGVSPLRASIPSAGLWPVYEFRPHPADMRSTVLRYADGAWLPDDGEWDIAFVAYGIGAPLGLYVNLPYQRNIVWSGLTSHWSASNRRHLRGNPWHYALREGETQWGGDWGRDQHPNRRAGDAAMKKCASINRCANGTGPRFEDGNRYIRAGLLRDRETKAVVKCPAHRLCMYCGGDWERAAQAIEARRAETGTGSVADESAVPEGNAPSPSLSSEWPGNAVMGAFR